MQGIIHLSPVSRKEGGIIKYDFKLLQIANGLENNSQLCWFPDIYAVQS